MSERECKTCEWFEPHGDLGVCRVNPPTATGDECSAEWPVCHKDDWCGKHNGTIRGNE